MESLPGLPAASFPKQLSIYSVVADARVLAANKRQAARINLNPKEAWIFLRAGARRRVGFPLTSNAAHCWNSTAARKCWIVSLLQGKVDKRN
jgi:hypothetical protein